MPAIFASIFLDVHKRNTKIINLAINYFLQETTSSLRNQENSQPQKCTEQCCLMHEKLYILSLSFLCLCNVWHIVKKSIPEMCPLLFFTEHTK